MEPKPLTITPQPGDLVFTQGNHFIEAWQRIKGIPHSEKTHVAVMVGTDHLIEATKGELVSIHSYKEWVNERDSRSFMKDSKRVILRSKYPELHKFINELYNRAAYHSGKAYNLSKAFKKIDDTDTAICSSLALDLLIESSIITSVELEGCRDIYPGELYEELINNGFLEIDIYEWERGVESTFGVIDARGHLNIRSLQENLLELNAEFLRGLPDYPDIAEFTPERYCAWFYKLEHQGGIFDYILSLINLATQLYDTHIFYRDLGPANYQDFEKNKKSMDENLRHIKLLERFIIGLAYQVIRLGSNLVPFTVDTELLERKKYFHEETTSMEEFKKEYIKRAFWAYSLTGKLGDKLSIPDFEIIGISESKEISQAVMDEISEKITGWKRIYDACSVSIVFLTQPINWRLEVLHKHYEPSIEAELENDCQQFLEYIEQSGAIGKA